MSSQSPGWQCVLPKLKPSSNQTDGDSPFAGWVAPQAMQKRKNSLHSPLPLFMGFLYIIFRFRAILPFYVKIFLSFCILHNWISIDLWR